MLGNVLKNNLLLRGKSLLLKRCSVPQVTHSVRSKWDTVPSKKHNTAVEAEAEDDVDEPIKYSTSKAATMRIDEYRDPDGDRTPWYQGYIVSASMAIFLGYFCILREENDIDLMLYTDLGQSLSKVQQAVEKKDNIKPTSK
ncbi:PREDICTED: uncharacterized protein LOC105558728 [Vollenhovia emeryi]|uniref:uncharacterized protein LOC105558728 n=1 Tax=Vollenhovia emeryi TaxID=411798 RepID=UPI0005F37B49|nr:PREDICTED: uncharacterized protein LOC105558728 [Vollenhovia emeryi]